jgi:hypothetical protein
MLSSRVGSCKSIHGCQPGFYRFLPRIVPFAPGESVELQTLVAGDGWKVRLYSSESAYGATLSSVDPGWSDFIVGHWFSK